MTKKEQNLRIWKKVATISAGFSLLVALLLIVNYLQYSRLDPVEQETINNLVERLDEEPDNEQLRKEIRTIDLLSRKAYFTSQWQIRTGGYLLLIGVILFVISMQMLSSEKKEVEFLEKDDVFFAQAKSRKWLALGGTTLVVLALLSAFLSHNSLNDKLVEAALPDSLQNNSAKAKNNITNNAITEDTLADEEILDSLENGAGTSETDTTLNKLSPFPNSKELLANYPTFRGLGGNGIVSKKDIPSSWNGTNGTNILWKTKIPLEGFNSPVIWGDRVFITGANASKREVYCFDANTGKILWTHEVKNIPNSQPAPKVTPDTGHAAPTMATDGRRAYAIFSNGDIIALDMEGNRVWAKSLGVPGNHYGHSSSLMLFQDKLIVQYDQKTSGKVMALSTETGKVAWSTDRKVKISWASPLVVFTGKATEILLTADPFVASYNPYSGKENWKIDCIFGEVGPSLAYADGVVFVTNEYANLCAIQIGEKPSILWENDEFLSDVPSPVATKEHLFLVTSYGTVVCYGAKDGKKFWDHDFGVSFYGSPILANGRIYLINMKGNTHIFSASEKFSEIANNPLGEKSVCTPAFADGRIFIRGDKSLFCIGKK